MSALTARPKLWQGYLAFGAFGMFLYLLVPPSRATPCCSTRSASPAGSR